MSSASSSHICASSFHRHQRLQLHHHSHNCSSSHFCFFPSSFLTGLTSPANFSLAPSISSISSPTSSLFPSTSGHPALNRLNITTNGGSLGSLSKMSPTAQRLQKVTQLHKDGELTDEQRLQLKEKVSEETRKKRCFGIVSSVYGHSAGGRIDGC